MCEREGGGREICGEGGGCQKLHAWVHVTIPCQQIPANTKCSTSILRRQHKQTGQGQTARGLPQDCAHRVINCSREFHVFSRQGRVNLGHLASLVCPSRHLASLVCPSPHLPTTTPALVHFFQNAQCNDRSPPPIASKSILSRIIGLLCHSRMCYTVCCQRG